MLGTDLGSQVAETMGRLSGPHLIPPKARHQSWLLAAPINSHQYQTIPTKMTKSSNTKTSPANAKKLAGPEPGRGALGLEDQTPKSGRVVDHLRHLCPDADGLGHQCAWRKESKVSTI